MALKKKTKNPPIFSHEFIIQNHADIVSCIAMLFVIGLLFQASSSLASKFIVLQHNTTEVLNVGDIPYFTYGVQDICAVFFYFLIAIVIHAMIQEYILDKLNRKLHLSKMKHSKFNESGQLLVFYFGSLVWAGDIIRREGYIFTISKLWESYPHTTMTFLFKFYFIVQFAYWLHSFPELYFQKIKKEDMRPRITYASLYFLFFTAAYVFNFTHIAVCLSFLHYLVECVFHLARLLYFAEKSRLAASMFMVWNTLFVLIRLGSITLSVLTFWYGLALSDSKGVINVAEGDFNTQIIRLNSLLAVGLLQAWMMWNFINFHLKKMRERAALTQTKKKQVVKRDKRRKEDSKKNAEDDVNELPEVDQNTKKDLRNRLSAKPRKN